MLRRQKELQGEDRPREGGPRGRGVCAQVREGGDREPRRGAREAARELAAVQHTLAVAALDLSEKLQERTEGLVKSLLAKKEGVPEELRAAAGEWSRAASAGRRELKTAVDRTHKLLNAYLDKTEKASAPAPKAKPAAKPAAKKKAAAKKPAAKKKAAPKAGA